MGSPADRTPLRSSADLGSLTVINEVSEAEEQETHGVNAGRKSDEATEKSVTVTTPDDEKPSESPTNRPTLLPPADLKRLEKKHKKALERGNQQKDDDVNDEVKKPTRMRAATCKTALVTLYYAGTTFAAVSAFVLLFFGIFYKAKTALIAGTLLAFSAFGMCTNHCFTQGVGVAKRPTEQEREVAAEEQRILASVAERNLSLAVLPADEKPQEASTDSQEAAANDVTRVAMASAVDRLLTRRLSTLGGLSVMCPDPGTRTMMRQHNRSRRSSMMHLARSMSIAPHETWVHPVGIEDCAEFA